MRDMACSDGGLEANGLAHADVWLRYAAGLWRVAAGAATGVGWMLGLSFCVLPLVVAVRLQPLAVRDDRPLPFLLGLSMMSVGLLALLQTEAFPATRFWTLFPDAPPVRGGFLLAAFSACASSTLGHPDGTPTIALPLKDGRNRRYPLGLLTVED